MKASGRYQEYKSKNFPKIKLLINTEADIWKINTFLGKISSEGADFQGLIIETHPKLKGLEVLPQEERLYPVKAYINKYYRDHKQELEEAVIQTVDKWKVYAPTFFENIDTIFKGFGWPSGEYKGFVSISPPYPRFLESKTFQYPLEPEGRRVFVIAHEMLHFIFYEYVRQRYTPQLDNTDEKEMDRLLADKFSIPLWELSEVFDSVILSQLEFGEEVSTFELGYPALKDYYVKVKQTYQDAKGNIDQFLSLLEVKY